MRCKNASDNILLKQTNKQTKQKQSNELPLKRLSMVVQYILHKVQTTAKDIVHEVKK